MAPPNPSAQPRPKVVIAEPIADAGIAALEEVSRIELAIGVSAEGLAALLADAEALVVRSATQVDAALIAAGPRLKVIGRAGIGVDNIDLDAATAAGILVVNAPQANTISAAEHTLALLLAQARRLPEADRSMREGRWDRKLFQGVELHGKTLGVLGLGRIGTLVAQRASAFGMRILAYDPYVGEERARRIGAELADLGRVLAEADFITIHLPLTRETAGLIGADQFATMRPGIRIVNTSRGGILDEDALADAVRAGIVAGAALDVFAAEPLGDSPLRGLPQVVLTPHLGASTQEAQDKAGVSVAQSVVEALQGELVLNAVNVDIGAGVEPEAKPFLKVAEHLGELFTGFARGLPGALAVRAEGRLAESTVRPFAVAVLKGALSHVSEVPVTFVNAPMMAESRGIRLTEEATTETRDYHSVLRLRGTVGEKEVSLAATYMGNKGPVLTEVNGYEIELPLTRNVLLVRNEDVPGVIGRVGTYLGEQKVNIANMVVGRPPTGEAAMMGLSLDQALSDEQVAGLLALEGIADARFVKVRSA